MLILNEIFKKATSSVRAFRMLVQILGNDALQRFKHVTLHAERLLNDKVRKASLKITLKHQCRPRLIIAERLEEPAANLGKSTDRGFCHRF